MIDPQDFTASIRDKDRAFVWHPFTQMQDWLADRPIVIESGDGAVLRDTDGNEYLDGYSSLWCNVHGHRRREIDDAIRAQLDRIAHSTHLGLANVPASLLAERLVRITPPGLSRVFYSDSGAEAVEIALKMAFQTQMKGLGFSLVEILSPCPTNWKMSPLEAHKYVEEKVMQIFPLKVIKDEVGKLDE